MAVKYKSDQNVVLEAVFSQDLTYEISEISFENSGISQLLGVYDMYNSGSTI